MEEVEETVLAAWQLLQRLRAEIRGEGGSDDLEENAAVRMLLRLLNPATRMTSVSPPSEHEQALQRRLKEVLPPKRVVSVDELWRWLFDAPSPHSCLSFLDDGDDAGDVVVDDDDDDDEGDAHGDAIVDDGLGDNTRIADEKSHQKKAIFRSVAGFIADESAFVAEPPVELPIVSDIERMLRRLHRARTLRQVEVAGPLKSNLEQLFSNTDAFEAARVAFDHIVQSCNTGIVLEGLRVLSRIEVNPDWLQPLPRLLRHENEQVRATAFQVVRRIWVYNQLDDAKLVEVLRSVYVESASSHARASLFQQLVRFYDVFDAAELVEFTMLGLMDANPSVAEYATRLLQEIVWTDVVSNPEILQPYSSRLASILADNIMFSAIRTLTDLTINYIITNTSDYPDHIVNLPEELQKRITDEALLLKEMERSSKGGQHETSPSMSPLCKATALCVESLCDQSNDWCTEFLPIIARKLDHKASWQLRESAVHLLNIIGDVDLSAENLELALSHIEFLCECLSVPSVNVRARASSALASLFRKGHDVLSLERSCMVMNSLKSCLRDETNPMVIRATLAALDQILLSWNMQSLASSSDPLKGVFMLCTSAYTRLPMNDWALLPMISILSYWMTHKPGSSIAQSNTLTEVLSIIEHFPACKIHDAAYQRAVQCTRMIISTFLASGVPIRLDHVCMMIKREIEWLCGRTEEESRDIVTTFNDWLVLVKMILKANEVCLTTTIADLLNTLVCIPINVGRWNYDVVMLMDVITSYAHQASGCIDGASAQTKQFILGILLDSAKQTESIDACTQAFRTAGQLALRTTTLIGESFVTALCGIGPDLGKHEVVHCFLQLACRFTPSIESNFARSLMVTVSSKGFAQSLSFKNALDDGELVGWANLVCHLTALRAWKGQLDGVASAVALIDCIRECDRLNDSSVICDNVREAVSKMVSVVLADGDRAVTRADLLRLWSGEEMQKKVAVIEHVLSASHPAVKRLKMLL